MTTFAPYTHKCFICGKKTDFSVIASTNMFGSRDLDTRPPEMERSTMMFWVEECSFCGYVADSIEKSTSVKKRYLKSDEYKYCGGIEFKSDLAGRFYKKYLIAQKDQNYSEAFYASLHAAWASDDAEDKGKAMLCRNNCVELIPLVGNEIDPNTLQVIKVDLLRRARRFDEVVEEFEGLTLENATATALIRFGVNKAKERDDSCYTFADVANA